MDFQEGQSVLQGIGVDVGTVLSKYGRMPSASLGSLINSNAFVSFHRYTTLVSRSSAVSLSIFPHNRCCVPLPSKTFVDLVHSTRLLLTPCLHTSLRPALLR